MQGTTLKNVADKEGPERLPKRFLPTVAALPTPSLPHANHPNVLATSASRPQPSRAVVRRRLCRG